MQIVIDISERAYDLLKASGVDWLGDKFAEYILNAVANGIPLPKGHGRLIDVEPIYDKLIRSYRADERDFPNRGKDYRVGLSNAIDLLSNAPTIIDADKE